MKLIDFVKRFTKNSSMVIDTVAEEPAVQVLKVIKYNPLHSLDTEDYRNATNEQREAFVRSHCKEAETVILTLNKKFPGEISSMYIDELDLSVACILTTHTPLTLKERDHIQSVSRYIKVM